MITVATTRVLQVDIDGGTGSDINAAGVLTAPITGNQGRQEVDLPDLAGGAIDRRIRLGHTSVSRLETVAGIRGHALERDD